MATKAEALAAYNSQHRTDYATVQDLGTALAEAALREAWIRTKIVDAHNTAAAEVIL